MKTIRSTFAPIACAAASLGYAVPVLAADIATVLNRSVEAVRAYWQYVVFSGRDVPPPQLASDADVVKYVATHEGAVGYVSGSAPVEGARVVGVE